MTKCLACITFEHICNWQLLVIIMNKLTSLYLMLPRFSLWLLNVLIFNHRLCFRRSLIVIVYHHERGWSWIQSYATGISDGNTAVHRDGWKSVERAQRGGPRLEREVMRERPRGGRVTGKGWFVQEGKAKPWAIDPRVRLELVIHIHPHINSLSLACSFSLL